MSPEQCQGAEDLDAKVDVYAMGVMLFENMSSVEKVREPFPTWL
jgi:serine/threonine protein kinase